ncbi:hypothetical protein D3C81_1779230 [compost metagenome]
MRARRSANTGTVTARPFRKLPTIGLKIGSADRPACTRISGRCLCCNPSAYLRGLCSFGLPPASKSAIIFLPPPL